MRKLIGFRKILVILCVFVSAFCVVSCGAMDEEFAGEQKGAKENNSSAVAGVTEKNIPMNSEDEDTPTPTQTPEITDTSTPEPTAAPTNTPTPKPTQTPTPKQEETGIVGPIEYLPGESIESMFPEITEPPTPMPTEEPTIEPTEPVTRELPETPASEPIATPMPTNTPTPVPTSTPTPAPTNTPIPAPTNTPVPKKQYSKAQLSYTTANCSTYYYVVNTSSKKFHGKNCSRKPTKNIAYVTDECFDSYGSARDWLVANGYEPCGYCKP